MYIVKTMKGEVLALCSSKKDAEAYKAGALVDKIRIIIEEVKADELAKNSKSGKRT